MAGSPPILRDSKLDLATLSAMAREFDSISRDDGRLWPATDFVRWLSDELAAPVGVERGEPRGRNAKAA